MREGLRSPWFGVCLESDFHAVEAGRVEAVARAVDGFEGFVEGRRGLQLVVAHVRAVGRPLEGGTSVGAERDARLEGVGAVRRVGERDELLPRAAPVAVDVVAGRAEENPVAVVGLDEPVLRGPRREIAADVRLRFGVA